MDLNVSNAGNFIGSQSFGVRQIPAPEIKARIRGKEIDAKTGILLVLQALAWTQ